ncbi:PLP-dependent aminotransferase family protein [Enterococcus sp. LJL51]|uniref:MocR-like pyridoxine biosynthesis transcription factor PdxR n=1 Tax=Enterococcus sp. LJL51 TaxID=3416656 RepID=UPI003CFA15B7
MYHLDRMISKPMYQQLYEQIKKEYQVEAKQVKLPSIRELAKELNISKTTVEQAYNQLVAEGLLLNIPQSGFYFLPAEPDSKWEQEIDNEVLERRQQVDFDFRYGTTFFYTASWNSWKRCVKKAMEQEFLDERSAYQDVQGNDRLRSELVKMLGRTRGVRCRKEQIVITSGSLDSLDIVLNLLKRKSRHFQAAIEDPGYYAAGHIFTRNGFPLQNIPVESEGISISKLALSAADLVYVTPSHQFPMGYRMSVARRQQLLQLIRERQGYIIEDDYDSEFRYTTQPLPSLQSLDRQDCVIYLGSFSKTISPTLRLGYMVLPRHLVGEYRTLYQFDHERAAYMIQEGMAEFLSSGSYYRHISKAVGTNKAKYHLLEDQLNLLKAEGRIDWIPSDGGLHVVMEVLNLQETDVFLQQLQQHSLRLYPLSKYSFSVCRDQFFLLGYGGLSLEELTHGLKLLKQVVQNLS